jgi:hypothetical protein
MSSSIRIDSPSNDYLNHLLNDRQQPYMRGVVGGAQPPTLHIPPVPNTPTGSPGGLGPNHGGSTGPAATWGNPDDGVVHVHNTGGAADGPQGVPFRPLSRGGGADRIFAPRRNFADGDDTDGTKTGGKDGDKTDSKPPASDSGKTEQPKKDDPPKSLPKEFWDTPKPDADRAPQGGGGGLVDTFKDSPVGIGGFSWNFDKARPDKLVVTFHGKFDEGPDGTTPAGGPLHSPWRPGSQQPEHGVGPQPPGNQGPYGGGHPPASSQPPFGIRPSDPVVVGQPPVNLPGTPPPDGVPPPSSDGDKKIRG